MHLWGIDLGGTKIEAVIVDSDDAADPVVRQRIATESDRGYEHIVGQTGRLIERLEAASNTARPAVIGCGTPGALEPATGTMKNCNTVALNGRRLGADLAATLGAEVRIANDANCFALAEATLGAARGRPVVMGLILGTGVGGGIVAHGRVLEGLHGIAGEWGHNPMRDEDTPCYCGRRGCVETVLAGPALERFHRARTGTTLALPEIVARARDGEPAALGTINRLRDKLGEALAAVINILDPHAVVIGGGVGNLDALYHPETRKAVERHLFNPELRTELLRPSLGDSAGVFGAALLARP